MQWMQMMVVLLVGIAVVAEARPKDTTDRSGIHVEVSTEVDKRSSLADSILQVTDQLITTPRANSTFVNRTLVLEDVPEGKANEEVILDEGHRGVAVPLTIKDLEREMAAMDIRLKESSTPKEGISTWILLSETASTVSPDLKGPTYEIGTESTTQPKATDIASKEMNVETPKVINGKAPAKVNPQRKKPKEGDKKKRTTTTTTIAPQEDTTQTSPKDEATTKQTPATESTTFLILEPKDADFDLPQDRSPSLHKKTKVTTKAPKPQKKKNNRNKKKPQEDKVQANKPGLKEKPISTKIYNYLSREVMPTVGVSLVGLVVTAGIASYLLGGPFGALRRSYDVDRKDDVYYNNNEEYAGPDGQYEEEWLTKVMAQSPTYRNSIRYNNAYRPAQAPNHAYHAYAPYNKYPQYSRYRTVAHHPAPQYNPHLQHPANYHAFKAYPNPVQAPEQRNTQKSISGSVSYVPNDMQTQFFEQTRDQLPGETVSELKASQSITVGGMNDAPTEKDNVLQHRSQFVVGSVIPDEAEDTMPVPEHGPRRRRSPTDERNSRGIDDNEVDDESKEPPTTYQVDVSTTTEYPEVVVPQEDSFVDLIRRLVDLKIRFGLSFLQNATTTFQRYLQGVQERIDHHPPY